MQTLSVDAFLSRFVQHVLPRGFVKVRHSGLLANRGREERLAWCRWLLTVWSVRATPGLPAAEAEASAVCPVCGVGRLVSKS